MSAGRATRPRYSTALYRELLRCCAVTRPRYRPKRRCCAICNAACCATLSLAKTRLFVIASKATHRQLVTRSVARRLFLPRRGCKEARVPAIRWPEAKPSAITKKRLFVRPRPSHPKPRRPSAHQLTEKRKKTASRAIVGAVKKGERMTTDHLNDDALAAPRSSKSWRRSSPTSPLSHASKPIWIANGAMLVLDPGLARGLLGIEDHPEPGPGRGPTRAPAPRSANALRPCGAKNVRVPRGPSSSARAARHRVRPN